LGRAGAGIAGGSKSALSTSKTEATGVSAENIKGIMVGLLLADLIVARLVRVIGKPENGTSKKCEVDLHQKIWGNPGVK